MVSCCLTSALFIERCRWRCRSILGQHSLDPRFCDRQVIKLIHLQPGWQSGGFSILASSSISSKFSLRHAFFLSTPLRSVLGKVNDSSIVLPLSLVSLVSHVSPASHVSLYRALHPCLHIEEENAVVVKVIPQERISERTVEQIADVPAIAKQLTRARRDSAGAGSAAHRGNSTPVTAHSSNHPEGFRDRDR